ncbi:hypothetical protein LINPERHAP1_LOCUS10266 [Linum perenne]
MQTIVLPATTCDEIIKRVHDFVWGTTAKQRKIHLLWWEKICVPKEDGGLGSEK